MNTVAVRSPQRGGKRFTRARWSSPAARGCARRQGIRAALTRPIAGLRARDGDLRPRVGVRGCAGARPGPRVAPGGGWKAALECTVPATYSWHAEPEQRNRGGVTTEGPTCGWLQPLPPGKGGTPRVVDADDRGASYRRKRSLQGGTIRGLPRQLGSRGSSRRDAEDQRLFES